MKRLTMWFALFALFIVVWSVAGLDLWRGIVAWSIGYVSGRITGSLFV